MGCDEPASCEPTLKIRGSRARPPLAFHSLEAAVDGYLEWLRNAALPLWWDVGADKEGGGFFEAITPDGMAVYAPRRARVQARQAYVYASVRAMGWQGPWQIAARHGMNYLMSNYVRGAGRIAYSVTPEGEPLDDTVAVYEQAFAMLAMATLQRGETGGEALPLAAEQVFRAVESVRHATGGFRETGTHPFQANAHMHLLEASMAWEDVNRGTWGGLCDEIAALAMSRFIDPDGGFLREFFDGKWNPAAGDDGRLIEPGHQFEWAWLLDGLGRKRKNSAMLEAAGRLYVCGLRGVDPSRGVAVNALWDDFSLRDGVARLWPQTEWLKAALCQGDRDQALAAANGLWLYLQTPARGAWRDRMLADGGFIEEPAPASSFYHIVCAALELFKSTGRQ